MSTETKNRILIIDDEVSNLKLLTHMLGQEYTVYAAKDGTTGIEMAKQHKPDLILLDMIMPDINGHEVLTKLCADENTKNIPVLIASGLDVEELKAKIQSEQVADYISKPFNAEIVKTTVSKQIQRINEKKPGAG